MEPKDLIDSGVYIGSTFLFPKKSIKLIINNLFVGEKIIAITTCNATINNEVKPGALAITNKRLIFGSAVLTSFLILDCPISEIISVSTQANSKGDLIMQAANQNFIISAISEITAHQFAEKVNEVRKNKVGADSKKGRNSENAIMKPIRETKTLLWRASNLWYIPFFHLTFFLAPFSMLYAGIKGKKKSWVAVSLIGVAIPLFAFPFLGEKIIILLLFFEWLFMLVYSIATAGEYLNRLEAIEYKTNLPIDTEPIKQLINDENTDKTGVQFVRNLHKWKREIEPIEVKDSIQKIIDISTLIQSRENEQSTKFFLRYGDTVDNLLKKYDEIENSGVRTKEITEAMTNLESTLEQTVIAFEKELAAMYKYDVMDMNAETKAFLQDLRNRGLLEDEN